MPFCYSPWSNIDISPTGAITPCCKFQTAGYPTFNLQNNSIDEYKNSIFLKEIKQEFTNFLRKYTPIHRCLMECTGVYHIPVYHHLQQHYEGTQTRIVAMNPLLLNRRISDLGTKEDKADRSDLLP